MTPGYDVIRIVVSVLGKLMTAAEFLDLLLRSQLVDGDGLRKFCKLPDNPDEIAIAMVKADLLTDWQAEKLLRGKWKGFTLGEYVLLDHFGKTRVGQEYVAEHRQLKHKVVLAVAPANRVADSTYLEQFRTETGINELRYDNGVCSVKPYIEG
jgi:hypothetical protein